MPSEMISIPFSDATHIWDDLDLDGVPRLGQDALIIEYAGQYTEYGRDGKKGERLTWDNLRVEVPLTEIAFIRLESRLFRRPRVPLETRSIQALGEFPLARGVQCAIPIARRYRAAAEELVTEVEAAIADGELKRLEG